MKPIVKRFLEEPPFFMSIATGLALALVLVLLGLSEDGKLSIEEIIAIAAALGITPAAGKATQRYTMPFFADKPGDPEFLAGIEAEIAAPGGHEPDAVMSNAEIEAKAGARTKRKPEGGTSNRGGPGPRQSKR